MSVMLFVFLKLDYSQGAKIASITVVLCLTLVIFIGILILKRGYKPARYFLFAWIAFLIGSILLALRQIGILPSIFLFEYGAQLGSTLEVLLLSLALADRINVIQKEKDVALAELLKAQSILNEELERKVSERTQDLQLERDNLQLAKEKIEILAESRKRLSLIGQMAAGIVHDLKNPMATIKALAEMANSEKISKEKRIKNLYLIIREMDRLSDIACEILDFSKGKLKLEIKEENLKDFISEIEIFLSIDFKYAWVQCLLDLQYEGNILIDKDRMRRVFINLAKNAIEAMYDGMKEYSLTIRTELNPALSPFGVSGQGDFVLISFIDNGPGLPESLESRIFEVFATAGKVKGTGLGLYMSKWIVEAHNGNLTYETKKGEGTSFYIKLPLNGVVK